MSHNILTGRFIKELFKYSKEIYFILFEGRNVFIKIRRGNSVTPVDFYNINKIMRFLYKIAKYSKFIADKYYRKQRVKVSAFLYICVYLRKIEYWYIYDYECVNGSKSISLFFKIEQYY